MMTQTKVTLFVILISILLSVLHITTKSDEPVCELNDDGQCKDDTINEDTSKKVRTVEKVDKAPANSFEVIFENQSGNDVELYWDDGASGILQGGITHDNSITINTFIGHKFYFVAKGNKNKRLYESIMYEHIGHIPLYDEAKMKERGKEFEIKKQKFYKEYFDRTGMRWGNYYPREPVKHNYYNFTHIGQEIKTTSTRDFYKKCSDDIMSKIDESVLKDLIEQENEWFNNNEINETRPIHPLNDEDPNKDRKSSKYDEIKGVTKLPHFESNITTDILNINIARWNKTFYCRNLISLDTPLEFTIDVKCTQPKVARIFNFLSDDEIEGIINTGLYNGMKRSTVSEEALFTKDRTSMTVWIERTDSIIVDNVLRRIGDVMKIPERKLFINASSESLQLVHYFPGELYKPHVDYGTDRPHNRFITFLMYLNDVPNGGNTSFPKASNECKIDNYFGTNPVKGSVAFFYNLFPDGNIDPKTQHYAEPPINSEKWMTNLWIWDEVFTR